MVFTFVDLSGEFVEACRERFGTDAQYFNGDVEEYGPGGRRVYYVSPANSLGFMDGGIDAVYSIKMFPGLETSVRKAIKDRSGHKTLFGRPYLPIGKALIVSISQKHKYYLVCAPTMLFPQDVSGTRNAYHAMEATLRALREHGYDHETDEVIVPGLCCGYGGFTGTKAADQIHDAVYNFAGELSNVDQILEEQPNYYENTEFKEIELNKMIRH